VGQCVQGLWFEVMFLHSHTIATTTTTTTTTTTSRQTVLIESDILRFMFLLSRGTPRRIWADIIKMDLKNRVGGHGLD